MISVVIPIWASKDRGRRWKRDLRNAVYSWSEQTVMPEVIVVDTSPTAPDQQTVQSIIKPYNATYIAAPRPTRNLSRAFNVGIKRANGDYILATGADLIAAKNYIEVITDMVAPDLHLGSVCGFLDGNADLDVDIFENWDELLTHVKYVKRAMGAIQCAHRDWWHKIRGYDENLEFRFVDSDIVSRAGKTLRRGIVKWTHAQLLHAEHNLSRAAKGCKHGRKYLNEHTDVIRNPDSWGE